MLKQTVLVTGNKSYHDVTNDICGPVETLPGKGWFSYFAGAQVLLISWIICLGCIVGIGLGLLGLSYPVGWGTDITTFVFWIGIGHAGTLISAILYLFRQKWRTGINRAAEAMTIFAVMTAGLYPLLHVGRPWFAYWLLPYPNQRGPLWVNFNSPLLWDVFAVSTYATVSLVFWYIGMVPDLATIRDRAKNRIRKMVYGVLSLGWRGTNRSWQNYEIAYLVLAGLSTPLVLSVHSIVSFDFAVSLLPGWHTTIFPPYFVAGAIFSGFGMVVTLMVLVREGYPQIKNYITVDHLEVMNKIIMTTSLIVGYSYLSEFFVAWYSGPGYERALFINRCFGPYWWCEAIMILCNVLIPQLFWFKNIRRSVLVMFIISICVNIGMWFERFTIIAISLHRDFLPSAWGYYEFTRYDFFFVFGSFGFFLTLFLLFLRVLPMVAIAEVKPISRIGREGGHHG
jgi:molybdopterin-containing oxidoreductase family membrane subunit